MTAAAFVTLGLTVGLPYYNLPFFYDYFERASGWSRADITLGFPLAALLTLWIGPLLVPRFSARKLIAGGSVLIALSLAGFAFMGSALSIYYVFWAIFTIGYMIAGPIPHQLIISHWFRRNRGKAMAIIYAGLGLWGSIGSLAVKPLTGQFGYRAALAILAAVVLLSWPAAILFLRDQPADLGQYPDGASEAAEESKLAAHSIAQLFASFSFWLLLLGSFCAIATVGAINFHLKFIFLDQGFEKGPIADGAWRTASVLILWSSIAGRLLVGALADRFSKKWVMTGTFALVASTVPVLLFVSPARENLLHLFAVLFGFGLGADYMLIPLIAADQFGINSLSRAMAVILPVNTIGQTWLPYFVSILRDHLGSYTIAMRLVLAVALLGALSIAIVPDKQTWQRKLSASS
ncbi:MAG TPA: MFS transporter [Bryobacteraceae bacterium]|nr:MFS transporter [Bryobacteraceae bacterium]